MFPLDDGLVDHSFLIYISYILSCIIVVGVCCVHLFDGLEVVDIFCTHTRGKGRGGRGEGMGCVYNIWENRRRYSIYVMKRESRERERGKGM